MLLGSIEGFEVVAAVGDGEQAIAAAREHRPDVTVMDIQMPVLDGIEATRRIIAEDPAAGIVVLTMSEDDETVFQAMRSGSSGLPAEGGEPGGHRPGHPVGRRRRHRVRGESRGADLGVLLPREHRARRATRSRS